MSVSGACHWHTNPMQQCRDFRGHSVITPVDQVDDYFDNGIFLLRSALRNQKGQSHQSIIR